MSTKSSLVYVEVVNMVGMHVYSEMENGGYFLDIDDDTIKLPNKEIAQKIAKVLEEYKK